MESSDNGVVDPANTPSWTARLAIVATMVALLSLASLHVLSPEFAPSWRMVSEYALGRYGWVLSLMFFAWGIGTWAVAAAIWPYVRNTSGKVSLWLLILSGIGEAMASYFDVTHEIGHGIAGLLGIFGFPVAALLLSDSLARSTAWRGVKKPLLWLANLNWISVFLLIVTLVTMTVQMMHANGGHLPQHAPKSLPPGVLALDGWADRLIILTNCSWILVAAVQSLKARRRSLFHTGTILQG